MRRPMSFRNWLSCALGATLTLWSWGDAPAQKEERCACRAVRFGLVSDLHFAHRDSAGDRNYAGSDKKFRDAAETFKRQGVDFIIQLGDVKDLGKTKEETLSFLREINGELTRHGLPVYHVLGNHDMDGISKEDFFSVVTAPAACRGKGHYAFTVRGVKFIALDACYRSDGAPYDSGNFDWRDAFIPKHEMAWLADELKRGKEPIVLFIHQLLDTENGLYKGLHVRNAADVNALLQSSGRVLAVFQGHHHPGAYAVQNGIHYFTMKSMVAGKTRAANAYAVVDIMRNGDILIDGFALCPDKILRRLPKANAAQAL